MARIDVERPVLALLYLTAASVAAPPPSARAVGIEYAQIIVRSHVVIRVETGPATPIPPVASMFREKKGPRCIALADVAGAAVIVPGSVDMALRSGRRVRARFASSCPALDYYSGFYVAPAADGLFCADRDAVRDRAGGECPVSHLRELTPR